MLDYWHKHPPVHKLVASFVGYEASYKSSSTDNEINQANNKNVDLDSFLETIIQPVF